MIFSFKLTEDNNGSTDENPRNNNAEPLGSGNSTVLPTSKTENNSNLNYTLGLDIIKDLFQSQSDSNVFMDIPDIKVESNFDTQCSDVQNVHSESVKQFGNGVAQVTHFRAPKAPDIYYKDINNLHPRFDNISKPNALFEYSNIACTQIGYSGIQNTQFGYSSIKNTQFGYSSIQNTQFRYSSIPNTQFGYSSIPNTQFGYSSILNTRFETLSNRDTQFGYSNTPNVQLGYLNTPNAQFGYNDPNVRFRYQGNPNVRFGYPSNQTAQFETLNTPNSVFGNSRTSIDQYSNSNITDAQFGISGMHDHTFLNDYNDQLTRSRFPVVDSHNINSNAESEYRDIISTQSNISYVNKSFRNEDLTERNWRVENSLFQTPAIPTIPLGSAVENRNLNTESFNALNVVNLMHGSPYALELNNSLNFPEIPIRRESSSNAFPVSFTSADSRRRNSYPADMQKRRVSMEYTQPRIVYATDAQTRHFNDTDVRLSLSNVHEIPNKHLNGRDTRIRQNLTSDTKLEHNNSTDVQFEDVTFTGNQNIEIDISDAHFRNINDKDAEYEIIDTGDPLNNQNTLFRKFETKETREICSTNTLINRFNFDKEVKCEKIDQISSVQTSSMQHAQPKVMEVEVETKDYYRVTVEHSNINREVKVFDTITGTVFNKDYLICSKCNFSCMIESQMREHVDTHKTHSCNVCFLSFDSKEALAAHQLEDLDNKNSVFNISINSKCETTFIEVQPQSVGGDSVRLEIEEIEDQPLTRMYVKPVPNIESNLLLTLGDENPNDEMAHSENDEMMSTEEIKLPIMESDEMVAMKDGKVQRMKCEPVPRVDRKDFPNVHDEYSKTEDNRIFKLEIGTVNNVVHNSSSIIKKVDDIDIEEEDLDHLISVDSDSSEFPMKRSANLDTNEIDELDEDENEDYFSEENKSIYETNSIRYEGGLYKCCLCYFTSPFERSYNIHLKNAHPDFKRLKCNVCSYRCRYWQNLRIHLAKHTGEKNFMCDQCSFKSANAYCLRRHKIIHSGKKSYSCNQCSYSTARKDNFVKHKSLHIIKPTYSCPKCPYKVIRKQDYDRHLLSHYKLLTEEDKQKLECHISNPYECHLCLFPCKSARNLKRHLSMHSGVKPFSCKLCSFKTARKDNFRTHMKIHSPAKPYKCEKCSFKTRNKHSLTRHSSTHELKTPDKSSLQGNSHEREIFKCRHCRYETRQEDLLQKHNEICNIDTNVISEIVIPKNASNEIYFVCCRCSYRTQYKEIMNIHIKRHDKFINIEDDGTLLLRIQDENITFKKEIKIPQNEQDPK